MRTPAESTLSPVATPQRAARLVRRWLGIVVAGVVMLFVSACGPGGGATVREEDDPVFQRGKKMVRDGKHQEALLAFQRVIDDRPAAPESHLEAGQIFLNQLDDPVAAIYHFRQFVALNPNTPQADLVRGQINTAIKKFAQELPGQPFEGRYDRLDLLEALKRKDEEILALKRDLALANNRLAEYVAAEREATGTGGSTTSVAGVGTGSGGGDLDGLETIGSRPSRYTVKAGDNLSKISTVVYGTPGRWQEIYEANRDRLASPHALKEGQTLRIP